MGNLNFSEFENLTQEQLEDVMGGSFIKDVAWVVAYGARKVYETLKDTDTSGFMASPVGAGPNGAAGK